ncbi:MAG: carbohydrate kinase family protein [Chlorobia bacterium]|nr:carbohydrate kinase family protein [Fimbriimonadaceae bacterium]
MILVFGTICIDRIRRVPHLPANGGYVEITEETDLLGGEAANTANALKIWGAEVSLYGNALGSGPDGDLLRRLLAETRLEFEAHRTRHAEPPAPVCDIYVTPDGERTMFGKNFSIMEADLSVVPISNAHANWFTAEPNMATLSREAARRAHQAGMKLYLMDFVGPNEPIPPGSFWQCSTDWTGTRNNTQKNVVWVQDWVARTGCFAILSDGPNGFVAGSPDHPVRAYPPFPAPLVVDTTGAGDMFRAGMLFGLNQDWSIPDCLRFASAAGCLKCRALGATTDVPTVEEIKSHIERHPFISKQYR